MSQAWSDFNIGFNNAVYGLDADFSELLVYDRALSTQDVASLDTYMGRGINA